jgi:hypothetical protein
VNLPRVQSGNKPKDVQERNVVYIQFVVGVFLVVFGALLFVIYKWAGIYPTKGTSDNTIGYVATAIIGAGVAVLPAGAAGAASARILSGAPSLGGGPTATTGASTATATGTVLHGTINGHGDPTNYYFEYGNAAGTYLTKTAVVAAPTGGTPAGVASEAIAFNAGGVPAMSNYRIVAFNASGTTYGADATVT